MDVVGDNKDGNISKAIRNKECIVKIKTFLSKALGIFYLCLSRLFFKCESIIPCCLLVLSKVQALL